MDWDRFLKTVNIQINTFDFINGHMTCHILHDSIRPAFHQNLKLALINSGIQGDFCLISGSHLLLDLPMDAASRLHRVLFCSGQPSVVQVAASHDKFHQIPHRDPDDPCFCFHDCPPSLFSPAAMRSRMAFFYKSKKGPPITDDPLSHLLLCSSSLYCHLF